MARTAGHEALATPTAGVHGALGRLQRVTAFLPAYDFRKPEQSMRPEKKIEGAGPVMSAGTSAAGLVGAALTLGLVAILGAILKLRRSVI